MTATRTFVDTHQGVGVNPLRPTRPRHPALALSPPARSEKRRRQERVRERLRARTRESPAERGYGAAHKRLRAWWKRRVELGIVACARCGRVIAPDEAWDLGHDDHDRSRYNGVEHARCNRATAGRPKPAPRSSRAW